MNRVMLREIFGRKMLILGFSGMLAGVVLLSACGVSQEEVDAKDQEIAARSQEVAAKNQEIAGLTSQLTAATQDAKYWTQLSTIFMPVEMGSMTDHKAFMTPDGTVLALHFDNMDLSKAQNLNWVAIGVPGMFSKQDQERIEKQFGKGFIHFHDMMADTHGGAPGAMGIWFMHIAVRDFQAPWGAVKPGVDNAFMPTPPPDVP